MTVGVLLIPDLSATDVVNDAVAQVPLASSTGVRQIWLGPQLDLDSIAVAAVIGATVPEAAVGLSVVPIYSRHPLSLAASAQTAQSATRGRFSLGEARASRCASG